MTKRTKAFQFLIGRLGTSEAVLRIIEIYRFQFLIGRLGTTRPIVR